MYMYVCMYVYIYTICMYVCVCVCVCVYAVDRTKLYYAVYYPQPFLLSLALQYYFTTLSP